MATNIDAANIARQIASALHDEYDGFTVDETDTGATRVPAGQIFVGGYLHNTTDDGDAVQFVVTVSQVEVLP